MCDRARPVDETGFCPQCSKNLIKADATSLGGGRFLYALNDACIDETEEIFYDGGRSIFAFSCLSSGIYRFKYMNRAPYAKAYAGVMLSVCDTWLEGLGVDAFIPVPLHKKRLIQRGYNQAEELACELSKLTGIPVNTTLIERVKNTTPQKMMDKNGRFRNMKKAFIVVENVVKLRRVVIVDDIFTTGSTINSMAKELKAAGVKEVFFLTLCRAGL